MQHWGTGKAKKAPVLAAKATSNAFSLEIIVAFRLGHPVVLKSGVGRFIANVVCLRHSCLELRLFVQPTYGLLLLSRVLLTPKSLKRHNSVMYLMKIRHKIRLLLLGCLTAGIGCSYVSNPSSPSLTSSDVELVVPDQLVNKAVISDQLGKSLKINSFPESIDIEIEGESRRAAIEYSLDEPADERMRRLFQSYRPDHGAFVALDARTGRIISLVSYTREHQDHDNLALRATFPAASIFKVVTASAALDMNKVNPDTIVPFNGSYHTLYKRNVQETRENRWTRRMTLREAFGRSVNVFFGKLGLFYIGPQDLLQYAERFRFNQPIHADIPVQTGYARITADDPWSVVTAASGFTKDNTMSPIHGAMIAAAIANDGVMMEPYLVQSLRDNAAGEVLYHAVPQQASVAVEPSAAASLRVLMRETVRSGTSRKSFRQVVRKSILDDVEFGGKTGSLTGGDPMGKCDWFVGYLRFKDQRIAVAALTVNENKWRVKSSFLASSFFMDYLRDLKASARSTAQLEKNHTLGQSTDPIPIP